MARKTFTTTIEEQIQNDFKSAVAKNGLQMNTVLEYFMVGFSNGDFKVVMIQENCKNDEK